MITPIARAVFRYEPKSAIPKSGLLAILYMATAMAAPKRLNTKATVVDVGSPNELYMSSRMTFAIITLT